MRRGHDPFPNKLERDQHGRVSRCHYCKKIYPTVIQLNVTLFLSEQRLALRGSSNLIGDYDNGNFLGIIELHGRYDRIMKKTYENGQTRPG